MGRDNVEPKVIATLALSPVMYFCFKAQVIELLGSTTYPNLNDLYAVSFRPSYHVA